MVYNRLSIIVSSILSSYYYYLEAKFKNGILLVFDKSYHDSTNNENSSQSIIVINVHSMLRDIEYGIGLSLHILCYGFIKGPYYMFIC